MNITKLKFLLFAFFCASIFTGSAVAQRSTVSTNYRTTVPTTCNSELKAQTIFVVKNSGVYQCINNVPTKIEGSVSSSPQSPQTPIATNRSSEIQAYPSLAAAVADIGTTGKLLTISTPTNCSTALTVPAGSTLEFTGTGKIVSQSGCSLTIKSGLLAGKTHIFQGFTKTNLQVAADVDFVYPEWFGAKGQYAITTFDDLPAVQLMFDTAFYLNARGVETGFHYKFGAKGYYFSDTLNINRLSYIEGSGAAGKNSATILAFPANKKGIIFQSPNTQDDGSGGFLNTGKQSEFSKISNLKVFGYGESRDAFSDDWIPTHNLTLSGQDFTRVSGAVMDRGYGYPVGTTVTIGRANWILEESGQFSTRLRPYRSAACGDPKPVGRTPCEIAAGVKSDIIHNVNGAMDASWIGMKVRRVSTPSVVWKIIAIPNNFNNSDPNSADVPDVYYFQIGNLDGSPLSEAQKIPDFVDEIEVFDFDPAKPINTNRPVRINTFHGIDARAQIWVENVRIRGFNGNGINFDSGLVSGDVGNQPNVNNSNVTRSYIYNVAGNGIYLRGTNANQVVMTGNDVSNTKGAGFFDISFLGNSYYSNHTSGTSGMGYSSEGGVNGSTYVGNYQEGGSPCNKLNQYAMWISGNACFSADNAGIVLGAGGGGSLRINKLSMVAPDGSRYFVTVGNGGVVTTTPY
jgi:hypothetical protein